MGKPGRQILSGIGIAVLFLGVLWILSRFVVGPMIERRVLPKTSPGLTQITTLTSVRFPPSAKLDQSLQKQGMQSMDLWARIEIEGRDVDTFIKQLPEDWQVQSIITLPFYEKRPKLEWWQPRKDSKHIAFDGDRPVKDSHRVEMFTVQIDLADPQTAVIWLWWMRG